MPKIGSTIGNRKILRLRFQRGSIKYYDILCLKCGVVKLVREETTRRGSECSECRLIRFKQALKRFITADKAVKRRKYYDR